MRAQFSDPLNIALGARGLEAFARFGERPGQEIDLHRNGYLFLLTRPDDVAAYEAAVALQNDLGVPTRMLTPRGGRQPWRPDCARTTSSPPPTTRATATARRSPWCSGTRPAPAGTAPTVLTGVEVLGLERGGRRRRRRPDLGAATVTAGAVVCAAGAWSGGVGAMAGVDLPVTPLRRQILVTEPLPAALAATLPASMPMTIDAATTFYLHREGPGVLLGMSWPGEEPGFRLDVDDAWLPDLTAAIEHRAPGLLDVGHRDRLGGAVRGDARPQRPARRGRSPACGGRFLYATGFSGHGFLQGPAVGEILRDLYLGRAAVRRRHAALGASGSSRGETSPGARDRLGDRFEAHAH